MAKHYLWSNFNSKINEWGRVEETLQAGEEVDAKKMGVTQDDFDAMVETGAVREDPYPDIAPDVAPAEYFREQGAVVSEALTPGERKELEKYRAAEAEKAASAESSKAAAPSK